MLDFKSTLLILILIGVSFRTQAEFCDHYKPSQKYIDLQSKKELALKKFSNQKNIAKVADETLSKLLLAKSPVITDWLKKRNLLTSSEDEIVREWRTYYALNFILTQYPHKDLKTNQEIESLMASINKLFSTPVFKIKMKSLFVKTQQTSLQTIQSSPLPESAKAQILKRIQSIQLYWMKDFKTSKFKKLPLDFLDWGIAYDPGTNEINMGLNAMAYPNDETYLAVFSHEIGHSFDSCRWGAFFEGAWPFEKVGNCLRTPESAGAKKRDDSKIEDFVRKGQISKDLAEGLKMNPTCNKISYPPAGIQADQLAEAFADWFSAEVLANLAKINLLHIRVDLCETKELNPGSSYPTNELRLNHIYFAQPVLNKARKDLDSKAIKYCGWNINWAR